MKRKLSPYFPIWLTLCLGMGLSCTVGIVLQNLERSSQVNRFSKYTDRLTITLQRQVREYFQATIALGSFFNASQEINRAEFHEFTKPLIKRYPGIYGMAWIQPVANRERAIFEKKQSRELPDFQIFERNEINQPFVASERSEYFPIVYGEPTQAYQHILGFDFASNPQFFNPLKQARDSGKILMSPKIKLTKPNGETAVGFILYHPVYARGKSIYTIQDRQQFFRGIAYSIYELKIVFESALQGMNEENLYFYLLDPSATANQQFLIAYDGRKRRLIENSDDFFNAIDRFCPLSNQCKYNIELGERNLLLVILPTPAFWQGSWTPLVAVVIGIMGSVKAFKICDRASRKRCRSSDKTYVFFPGFNHY